MGDYKTAVYRCPQCNSKACHFIVSIPQRHDPLNLGHFLVLRFAFVKICEYLALFLSVEFGMVSVRITYHLCLGTGHVDYQTADQQGK